MVNTSGYPVSHQQQQPATALPRPALVAYSDSDSESSSPEGMLALAMTTITPTDDPVTANPTTPAGTRRQLRTTTLNQDTTTTEGGKCHDWVEYHDTNMDNDDETISDINDETHNIKFESPFAGADEKAYGGPRTPQCWGDIKYPRIGTCDHEFKIVNKGERYRKVVSDFFGRNKKATASVPADCYPTICRTCYQRLAYRLGSMNKDDPEKDAAAVAKIRCDAIIAALQKMKDRKFIDRHGYEWPWWCGLELQLTNDGQALLDDPEGLEAEIEKKNGEVAKRKADKAKSPQGKSLKRLHKRVKPEYLPDWLQKLCQAKTDNDTANDVATSTIGDRNGVRYSFEELITIVKAIKTYCHESRCAFPTIEAVPVPLGLLDEQILKDKRKLRATANKTKTETKKAAADAERDARDQPSNKVRKRKATAKRQEANEALSEAEAAERAVDEAQEDALLSAGTVPEKRRRSEATPGKAKITLKKIKAEEVVFDSPSKTSKKHGSKVSQRDFGADDDDNAADDEDDYDENRRMTKPRPAKRARASTVTKGSKGTYLDWKSKMDAKNLLLLLPPPPANPAELRTRMAQARRDGYYLEPHSGPEEWEDE